MNSSQRDQLIAELESLIAFIIKAQELVHRGEIISMPDIEREADRVCKQIMAQPQQDLALYQPLMADMITQLDILVELLEKFKHEHLKE